jgi:hypothetical protein
MKKAKGVFLFMVLFFFWFAGVSAQETGMEVKGIIYEIAADGTYIVVNDTKILTDPEFVEDALFEIGDLAVIVCEETAKGLTAISYKYIYTEEKFLKR